LDKNKNILNEMAKYVPEGYINPDTDKETVVSKAKGSVFYDCNGKKYIDFTSGIFTNSFGHCFKPAMSAARKQNKLMDNVHGRRTRAELLFYKRLSKFFPAKGYCFIPYNDGGYAIDRGLSDIVNHFNKKRIGIAAFRGGFHGKTMAAKLTINETEHAALFDNFQVDFPYCYRCPKGLSNKSCQMECAKSVCDTLKQKDAKALLFEPVQGAGIIIPPKDFWTETERFCKSVGIIMFADEVLTGGGRTGNYLASVGNFNMSPDIIALTKGLANGHPLSVLCEKRHITDNPYAKREGERSSTFAAHPGAMAIAASVLENIEKRGILSHVKNLERKFAESLEEIKEECVFAGDARCIGLMGAVEFVKDRAGKTPFPGLSAKVRETARKKGLELLLNNHMIRLAPPLNIPEKTFGSAIALLKASIKESSAEFKY